MYVLIFISVNLSDIQTHPQSNTTNEVTYTSNLSLEEQSYAVFERGAKDSGGVRSSTICTLTYVVLFAL
jgi:hypothetical protein